MFSPITVPAIKRPNVKAWHSTLTFKINTKSLKQKPRFTVQEADQVELKFMKSINLSKGL